ncbi:DUF308 domain-containing protein [Natronosporangium hydrolyticum]|uniref:DUF308 domain-containing protein n=1 Tax=Natronosporangium hydrolyticum TaxID=2811111 RepID=A0A895YJL7_9ACTN|nr:DUF308 domain-containing protein [Natronosporangium hydrolyticum]QSB16222.1 DUF308 domain-containing protein [Natronosporangium hydrolyticum]
MAAAERRRGRRDNGLDAADWRAIHDLDPRMAEDVLDLLATEGIAAYVQPAVDVDPVTRSAVLPSRPSDRLFVDRKRVEAARDCVRPLLGDRPGGGADAAPSGADPADPGGDPDPPAERPTSAADRPELPGADQPVTPAGAGEPAADRERSGHDIDATFAGIIADFDRQVDPTSASWPAAEDIADRQSPQPWGEPPDPEVDEPSGNTVVIEPTSIEPPSEPRRRGPVDGRDVTEPSLLDSLDTFGADLADQEPPERFVPPTPPPLPRFSRQTVLGWVAIAVGLLLLLGRPAVVPLDRSSAMLLGFASILGGAVALILRLRPGTDPGDQQPNDGAKV